MQKTMFGFTHKQNNSTTPFCPISKVWLFLLGIALLGGLQQTQAATRTASVTGNWNATATWGGSAVPVAGDIVIINSGITVTVNVTTATVASITINAATVANGITISGSNVLNVSGAITINAPTALVTSTVSVGSGTLNAGSVSIAGSTTAGRNSIVTVASGIINLTGNLSFSGTAAQAQFTFTGGGTLNLAGNLGGGGTFTPSTGTVNCNNAGAQSVNGYTYYNLTLSGSGDKTLASATTINNNLYISNGTRLIDNQFQITGNASGTLTVENNATLFLGQTAQNGTVSTVFPTGYTKAHIALQTGSIVQYNSWVAQTISTVPDYYNVECQYPGTKQAAAGTLTINGYFETASPLDLNTNDPTVNVGDDFNLLAVGAAVSLTSGVLSIKGDFSNTLTAGGSITTGNGTVVFNGTGAQSITGTGIVATPFYNLTINNTSTGVTNSITGTNSAISVANVLTMTAGVLTTTTTNIVNVTNSLTTAIAGGSATSFINGPVNWTLKTSMATGSTYTFPVGKGANYLPFALVNPTTGTGTITATIEAFNASTGGSPNFTIPNATATLGSLGTTEYWSLVTTGNFTGSSVSLTRPTAITPFDVIAGSTTLAGTYTALGGTVASNGISTSSAIGSNRFFTFGRINGIRINGSIATTLCAGIAVTVNFDACGVYTSGNVFTAQLSNSSGSFASPVAIGTLTQTTATGGTFSIAATIPANTTAGSGYRIRVISSNPSVTGIDNGSNITINPILPASVSITASATTICSGTSVTFTATPTNGGTPTYQWKINGNNVVGQTAATFTSTTLANNDAVTVVMTATPSFCFTGSPATSNSITMVVNALPTVPTIVSPTTATSICSGAGTSINLNATSSGATIYWYTVATAGTSIGNVASGVNFSVTPTATTTYYAEARSVAGCIATRAATATITYVTPAAVQVEFTQGVNDKTYTLSGSSCGTVTGGGQNDLDIYSGNPGGSATYQWQVSYDGGTNWVNGPGPTATTTQYVLDPVYTIYETTAGTYKFRVIITNLGCSATSDVLTLTNSTSYTFTPGTIAGNQSSCTSPFNAAAFTQTVAPSGGGTTYTYQWQQSATGTSGWTNIGGATASTYTASNISTTTYFRRITTSSNGCSGATNTLTITIGAATISVTTPAAVCAKATAQTTTLNYTVTAGTPTTYSITWNVSPTNSFAAVTNAALGSAITINIPAGTLAGTYTGNITVKTAGGCVSTALPFSVTVNALPSAPTIGASATTTFCAGGSVTLTSSAGTAYLWSTGATTASIVASTAGSYTVSISNASGCYSPNSVATVVTVNANPAAPTVDITTAPTCAVPTGSFHFNNLPASGSWTLTQSGTASGTITGSGSATTVSGLAVGSYTYIVTNSNGCVSTASSSATVTDLVINTWSGAAWSKGTPTIDQNLVFNGTFSSTGDITGCSCTVTSGNVVINANHTLNLSNAVTVSAGSLTFANNASLMQTNPLAVNSGSITYNRDVAMKQYDYVYWSAPVSGFNINNLSTTQTPGPKYAWNTTVANSNGGQGNWQDASGATMTNGNGYIVRAPGSFTATASTFTASFVGVPNNGTITVPVSRGSITSNTTGINGVTIDALSDNWNLVGNPYPSAIRASQFLFDNQATIEGSVRLWTHHTMPSNTISSPFYGSFVDNYTPNDYLTYNFTGSSVGPTTASDLFIGAGQGFFVEMLDGAAATSNITFSNGLRSAAYSNATFYKTANQSTMAAGQQSRIWLDIVGSNNAAERTLVGYVDGATDGKDNLYDASCFIANSLGIYSVLDNQKLAIQGRALPFNEADVVPIGVAITTAGSYSIAIGALDGLFDQQNIYVEDTYLNVISDLKQSPYTFTTAAGTFNDRFKLRYTTTALGTPTNVQNEATVKVITAQEQLAVVSNKANITKVELYDTLGKLILSEGNLNTLEYKTQLTSLSHQMVIVKVTLDNQQMVVKKVLVN